MVTLLWVHSIHIINLKYNILLCWLFIVDSQPNTFVRDTSSRLPPLGFWIIITNTYKNNTLVPRRFFSLEGNLLIFLYTSMSYSTTSSSHDCSTTYSKTKQQWGIIGLWYELTQARTKDKEVCYISELSKTKNTINIRRLLKYLILFILNIYLSKNYYNFLKRKKM